MEYGPRTRVESDTQPTITSTLLGINVDKDVETPMSPEIYTSPGVESSKYMEDVVTEGYRRRIAAGAIINNPMYSVVTLDDHCPPTSFKRTLLSVNGDGTKTGNIYDGETNRPIGPYLPDWAPVPEAIDLEAMKAKCITQAYANRSMVVQAVSMTLAEGKKTIQGVYEILFRVIGIAKAAKRLDYKYLADELSPSELKDRYMELRYAIRPLVIDAENIVKALGTNMDTVRKTARGGDQDRAVESEYQIYDTSWVKNTDNATNVYDVSTKAGVLCDVVMTKPNVWGIDQFIETVWEIVPFSFIVNWFVDFASLFSSWTPKAGVTERASWVSAVVTETQYRSKEFGISDTVTPPFDITEYAWRGAQTKTVITKTRIPKPDRSFWPSIDVKLDTLKLLDLGIILSGILSGKITRFMK